MVQKNFYRNKYFRSIYKQKFKIKKLFVRKNWIAHHGIERSGTNFLRAILIKLKINLINQFDPAESHPTHKHFRWYKDKSLIPNLKKTLFNDIIAKNINEINNISKYFSDTKHLVIKKNKLAAITSIVNYFSDQKILKKDEKFEKNVLTVCDDYTAYYDFWEKIYEKDPNKVQIIFYDDLYKSSMPIKKALSLFNIKSKVEIPKRFVLSELYESSIHRKKNISENEINLILLKNNKF